jgi:transmembrane sensor
MIWWLGRDARRRRTEKQAYRWVGKIIADPARNEAGLRRWIGNDEERARIYNRAWQGAAKGGALGGVVYGDARVRAAHRSVEHTRKVPYLWLMTVTVGLMLIGIALTFGISLLFDEHPAAESSLDGGQSYATAIGEVRTLALPDGSSIVLDTHSAVEIHFDGENRKVTLIRGRARFSVAHEADRPFVVSAQDATVTARGTVFDVDTFQGVRIALIEGAVDVRGRGVVQAVLRLSPGQQVWFNPADRSGTPAATRARPSDAQWVNGMKTFDDVPAREVIAEANRYSETQIVFEDPTIGDAEVFLDLHIRNTADVARNLAAYLHLEIDESHPGQIVLRRPK